MIEIIIHNACTVEHNLILSHGCLGWKEKKYLFPAQNNTEQHHQI